MSITSKKTKEKTEKTKAYCLTICPAVYPEVRHKLEDSLKLLGYKVHGGGTDTYLSECRIWFSK